MVGHDVDLFTAAMPKIQEKNEGIWFGLAQFAEDTYVVC